MKGILINPTTRTITEIKLSKDYKDIYPIIGNGCRMFECPYISGLKDHSLFCDEEGAFKQNSIFHIDPHYIRGNALILGLNPDNGDSADCTLTIDYIKTLITWIT